MSKIVKIGQCFTERFQKIKVVRFMHRGAIS